MARTAPSRIRRTIFALPLATALTTGFGVATTEAAAAVPNSGPGCLWAGTAHAQGAEIAAGGRHFTCGIDKFRAPHWYRGAPTTRPSTVANPGAHTAPTGLFSAGARQPGTSYTDYCSGDQLIPGTQDIYQAVRHRDGNLYWKAVAPISEWAFDPVQPRPEPTWRTSSLCRDGNLM
ncbi:hypothetical protein NDR87_04315 [Nocardia sp. CDC159]|uniref:Secreted protein n=1 Tax=Nocardia pulmonis TaxID=2951408 RepID=A0A9X2E2L5_9NOCA|nr:MULTISPECIES: hypothetical protein [Nocardia]MCM6773114.1 hypothetical protein [Nocardia pulmonis]MCM6785583.1 hypothetical protein [Nocardia sp. CDC159]